MVVSFSQSQDHPLPVCTDRKNLPLQLSHESAFVVITILRVVRIYIGHAFVMRLISFPCNVFPLLHLFLFQQPPEGKNWPNFAPRIKNCYNLVRQIKVSPLQPRSQGRLSTSRKYPGCLLDFSRFQKND